MIVNRQNIILHLQNEHRISFSIAFLIYFAFRQFATASFCNASSTFKSKGECLSAHILFTRFFHKKRFLEHKLVSHEWKSNLNLFYYFPELPFCIFLYALLYGSICLNVSEKIFLFFYKKKILGQIKQITGKQKLLTLTCSFINKKASDG